MNAVRTQHRLLRELKARVILALSEVEIRGAGASAFLYVAEGQRSANVSWRGNRLWVVFWDSLDQHVQPAVECGFDSLEDTEAALIRRMG